MFRKATGGNKKGVYLKLLFLTIHLRQITPHTNRQPCKWVLVSKKCSLSLAEPDRPRNLIVSPLDLEMRNIGLKVTWLEPENPYGILENYNIYYRVIPWNVTHVQHKNHCEYGDSLM